MESHSSQSNADIEEMRGRLRSGRTLQARSTEPSRSAPIIPMRGESSRNGKKDGKSRRSASRFQVLNAFVDGSARLVDTTAQAAWLALFRDVRSNGVACVSFGQIAEVLGTSRRTVIRAIKTLEQAKLITVVKRGRMNGGPSTYRVHGSPTEANS